MNDELKQFSIPTDIEVVNKFSDDDRFTHVKLSLCTDQQYKANGMHFGKSVLEKKQGQIDFMPIFGLIKIVENDDGTISYEMGDHETSLEYENGKLQYKSKTVILGVALPNTSNFEEITRNDVTKEYLTFEALLYSKKYPQLKTLATEKLNASMEISKVERHYDEEMGRYEIDDFCLDAHCLLGESVRPAFHEAGVLQVFSMDNFKDEYSQIMEEIKFSLENAQKGDVEVEENKVDMEQEETKDTDADKENSYEDLAKDEVKNIPEEDKKDEEELSDEDDKKKCEENFELSHDDIRNLLSYELDDLDADGHRSYNVWVMEVFDAYCVYQKYGEANQYFKATYTKSGETVVIGDVTEVFMVYLTQEEKDKIDSDKATNKQKYSELAIKFAELKTEVETLRQFKEDKDEEVKKAEFEAEKAKKETLIDSFSSKLSKEEIDSVVIDVDNQTFEEIKTGLSIAFADKELKGNGEVQTFANIGGNKPIDINAKLLAEMKARKNNKKLMKEGR